MTTEHVLKKPGVFSRSSRVMVRWLFEPSTSIEQQQRPRVRLLSIYLLLMTVNTLGGAVFLKETFDATVIALLIAGMLFGIGYAISRTRYYMIAMAIGIIAPAFPSLAIILSGLSIDAVIRGLIWLSIPLLLSSILLPLRTNYYIAISYVVFIIIIRHIVKIDAEIFSNFLAYMFIVYFFVIAIAVIRQRDQSRIEHQLNELEEAEVEREGLVQRLQDKTNELEQIVYIASHDLRSPLVNIQGFTKELELSLAEMRAITNNGDIPPEVKEKLTVYMKEDIPEALNFVLAGTSKIDSLLSGLLRLSRLGQAALDIQTLNMNDMLREINQTLEFTLKQSNINLEVTDLPECQGDKIQINQVFSNLIDNAIKYRDPERPAFIRITGESRYGQAIFCVEDNGIGIAEQHRQRVFEVFRRIGRHKSTGEGLGLSIVRRILDRHSGKIWLESDPGKGSKFFISLPARNDTKEGGHRYADPGNSNTHS